MTFHGIRRVFSTVGDAQYETIGAFWEALSKQYGIENLRGLGCGWTNTTIEYVIGLKDGIIPGADCTVTLPDEGWTSVTGKTEDLGSLYEAIYKAGPLTYEIETFTAGGGCEIMYYR